MARVFGHGGLRLVLLSLLEDGPKTGYDLIVALEDRFMGMYRPSSGTIYPRLTALEDEGLITSEETEGKRVYHLTDEGREELRRRREELEDVFVSAASSLRDAMGTLQSDIRAAVAAVKDAVRDETTWARADAADAMSEAARAATEEARRVRRAAEDVRRQAARDAREARRTAVRDIDDLVADVAAWSADAVAQMRRFIPDDRQRERLREAFADVRQAFEEIFESDR